MNKEYFLSLVDSRKRIDPVTGCWLWPGTRVSGYGRIIFKKKIYAVHRLSAVVNGIIPSYDSKELTLHKLICSNKHCFNPEHLYSGNASSNAKDSITDGKHPGALEKRKTHCPRGHEYNEKNTYYRSNGKRKCRQCNKLRQRGSIKPQFQGYA